MNYHYTKFEFIHLKKINNKNNKAYLVASSTENRGHLSVYLPNMRLYLFMAVMLMLYLFLSPTSFMFNIL